MATISRFIEGGPAVVLAQVFVTARLLDVLEFEILEVNAGSLRDYIGKRNYLTYDNDTPFWGELVTLEPCDSTAPGLRLLRDRPTLKGIIKVFPPDSGCLQ